MKKIFIALSILLAPASFAYAQDFTKLDSFVNKIVEYAGKAVGFLMILATIYFIWCVLKLIQADEKTRAEAKQKVTWAVIGLGIMVCVWGLIRFAANTLGVQTTQAGVQVVCPLGTTWIPGYGNQPGRCQ